MPVWLTWKVFWKVAPYIGAALALLGAVWYIDHRGFKRAEAEATARENAARLQEQRLVILIKTLTNESEQRMQTFFNNQNTQLVQALGQIETTSRTVVQPTLVREINNDPRFSDPDRGITDGMLGAINTARSLSQCPNPAGTVGNDCFTLPASLPASGSDSGDAIY